jgi:hypothetical protein
VPVVGAVPAFRVRRKQIEECFHQCHAMYSRRLRCDIVGVKPQLLLCIQQCHVCNHIMHS